MKKTLLSFAFAASSLVAPGSAAEPATATLILSAEAACPRIEPEVYGQFAEHLGAGVYGGLWVGPELKIRNTRGWRRDVVQALRQLQVPVVRWPGRCFADDYDWRDGIGAPAKRPARLNKVWGGVIEPNDVGTHKFMDLAEQLGTEVYLAGNMCSMPPRSMAQWLEYMTSYSKSALAAERRRNGRDKSFGGTLDGSESAMLWEGLSPIWKTTTAGSPTMPSAGCEPCQYRRRVPSRPSIT